jgi:hypothetical protein
MSHRNRAEAATAQTITPYRPVKEAIKTDFWQAIPIWAFSWISGLAATLGCIFKELSEDIDLLAST